MIVRVVNEVAAKKTPYIGRIFFWDGKKGPIMMYGDKMPQTAEMTVRPGEILKIGWTNENREYKSHYVEVMCDGTLNKVSDSKAYHLWRQYRPDARDWFESLPNVIEALEFFGIQVDRNLKRLTKKYQEY